MMPETELDGGAQFAERIRKKLKSERLPAGEITLSLGIAAFPMHGDAADQLIAEADAALYLAKRAGGDRVTAAARPKVSAK
jgi:diguanylate cyclase (GGDEF)-like protein